MRVLFLVRGLNVGGAQRQLVVLARGLRRRKHEVAVAVFYGGGVFEKDLRGEGVPVHDLAKRGRWDTVPFLARLARLIRSARPDVVHAYMGGANIFSAALKLLSPPVKVVWSIRTAKDDLRAYGWVARIGHHIERMCSPLADAVVVNSEAARRQAVARGMDAGKMVVIPNGIDCEGFRPDAGARESLRREWRIPSDAPVVGLVARLDPVKNHATFLRAAASVLGLRSDARFVCVGGGEPAYRRELERLATSLRLTERLIWAGECRVTRATYGALDVVVLSSQKGESFPNVVAEAMACGKPVVVTDTGDAATIVSDTGVVVPPNDPEALARGIVTALERAPVAGIRARERIEREYSVDMLLARTERALERVVSGT